MFAGKKSAQIREILISESAWEEMTCLFAPSLAFGMYAGYCGTLMTPMAANFNIVPAALLELKDKYQVIKIQIPTALTLLVVNVFLMYFLVFR